MAQAVFDEHPLEQYLREVGEGLEIMPGSTAALTQELEPFPLSSLIEPEDTFADNSSGDSEWEWRPQFLIYLLQSIETLVATAQLTKPTNPLVEQFKYNVISSSLLSPDLPTPHALGQARHSLAQHHSIPGNLPHSRTSSELSQVHQHPGVPTSYPSDSAANEAQFGLLSALVVLFAALLNAGLTRLAILTLWTGLAGIYYLRVQCHATRLLDLTPCLETLDELISVNTDWETIIQEVIAILEKDERNVLSSSTACTSPASSLRVALHSTLQTTQTQCDNVRHLLSALTSPSDLSQLSEMYAPPSPYKQNFAFHDIRAAKSSHSSSRKRRQRPMSIPTPPSPSATATNFTDHKRMTWNGSHNDDSFYANNSSSMVPVARRKARHRSDLSPFLGTSTSTSASISAPVTPAPSSPLARVSEDIHDDDLDVSFLDSSFDRSYDQDEEEEEEVNETTSFGAAALKLHRNRTINGLEAFSHPTTSSPSFSPLSSPPRSHPRPSPSANTSGNYILPISPRSSFVGSSRFTALRTSRQPLSLSVLRHALQAAIGAKRYACAHLLALRFREEDSVSVATPTAASMALCGSSLGSCGILEAENTYWDDVKSIMELLTSTLSDASSRLCEALREAEAMRLRDQTPTPLGSIDASTGASASPEVRKLVLEKEAGGKKKRLSEMIPSHLGNIGVTSFAPMPNQLSRFAGHVAAVQSGLEDARGYLEECVGALNDSAGQSELHPSAQPKGEDDEPGAEEHPALRAYEKLRRELGFALRECERGRNILLDLVKPPQLPGTDDEEGEGSEEGTPGLGHDSLSEESDKADNVISPSRSEDGVKDGVAVVNADEELKIDDASRELLLSADASHLPPAHASAEQVFEADTPILSSTPVRPKSKLSREERIKLVKARRKSGLGLGMATDVGLGIGLEPSPVIHGAEDSGGYDEKWGPGGDVVQELKDVIWKVGERRRKVQSQQPAPQQPQPSPSLQHSNENSHSSPSVTPAPSPSSLHTLRSHSISDFPVLSPEPRSANRASPSSSLARSSRRSLNLSQSLIPRRTSLMNMRSVLESLQKEVSESINKDDEPEGCVLSSE
ncbi:hypothetical protein D9756_002172 [Leucocoprinus leucothites]|uniref:Uncharacterized protein n=1 Tax=Leucocoprinus leucothites TaxID=201217 RepID=A0A8H5GCF7_9AGAR|nr:hypothetical protein D9756_002172 [Leucoagaricus leucothites]